jgi:hypothetical protein
MNFFELLDRLSALPTELVLLPPVIVVATILVIALTLRRARLNRWRAIAESTGLRLNERTIVHSPEVVGAYRGRPLRMTIVGRQRGSMRLRKTWTLVSVAVANPTFMSLKMYRQDVIDTALASFGMQDLKVGDETFDRRFIVQSGEPEIARRLLKNEALRSALIQADIERVEMFNASLRAYYGRDERDSHHARLLFDAVVDLAQAIDALQVETMPQILS